MKHNQKLKQALQELDALKEKVESLMKPELEEGKWYRVKRGSSIQFNKSEGIGYGINEFGTWVDNCRWMANEGYDKWQEATPQEVEEALIKEAKRRGFTGGVTINISNLSNHFPKENIQTKGSSFMYKDLMLGFGPDNYVIFKDGIWATIIEQPIDKFAELKEAHKNGSVIQYRYSNDEEWDNTYENKPSWQDHCQYRIKPGFGWSNNVDSKTWTIRFNDPTQSIHDDIKALMDKYPKYRFSIIVEDKA